MPISQSGHEQIPDTHGEIDSIYHDAGTHGDDTTAVRVWDEVAVANRQKCHDDHPHRVEHILVLTVVITANTPERVYL